MFFIAFGTSRIFLRQRNGVRGKTWFQYLPSIWSNATGSMKLRNGTSKFGTNPIWISGQESPNRQVTGSFTTTPHVQLRGLIHDYASGVQPPHKQPGWTP